MEANSLKLLAIDDDKDDLTTLAAVVRDALPGWALLTALNGPQGIELAGAEDPDVVLIDIVMPGMDGFEVCRRLKADERLRSIPIIFLTGVATGRETRIAALEAGAEAFLSKPPDEQALMTQVRVMAKLKAANRLRQLEKHQLAGLVAIRTRELEQELAERKRAEEALRQSEEKFSKAFQVAPYAIAISGVEDGTYIEVNDAFTSTTGFSREETIGASSIGLKLWVNEEDRKRMVAEIRAGRAVVGQEYLIRTKSGKILTCLFSARAIQLSHGLCVLSATNDITERKRAEEALRQGFAKVEATRRTLLSVIEDQRRSEEALRESEQRFRGFVENASDIVYSLTTDGVFTYVSPNWLDLMGGPAAEAVGKSFELYVHPDDLQTCREFLERILTLGDRLTSVQYRVVRRDGTIRWHSSKGSPLRDGDGKVVGVVLIARDITEGRRQEREKERLQAQLNQAQKMESVGRLAGGVAHDINNMLSVILGNAELAVDEARPGDPLHDYLEEILDAARRSTDITRQLLAFARKQTISPKVLDLNETLEGMLKMLRRLIGEDIDLAWLPGAQLWPVKMDSSQIDQVLANLCVNARDAISGVGKVTIETNVATFDEAFCADHAGYAPGDFVLLAVSDNGCGMDEETLDRVFDPFFTTKDVSQGTGLGLATVYGIVKQNNGFIQVYSEPGKGTTFRIFLPRHEGGFEEARTEGAAQIPRGRGEMILVVEDESAIIKMGKRMLEELGYQVLTASRPSEALRLAGEHAGGIHLLITDVVMPEMNGRDLANQVHTLYPRVRILFMSGYTANLIAHRGVLDDGVNFIEKPFSKKDLAFKVRGVLDQK